MVPRGLSGQSTLSDNSVNELSEAFESLERAF
jgi:hypothetical protein